MGTATFFALVLSVPPLWTIWTSFSTQTLFQLSCKVPAIIKGKCTTDWQVALLLLLLLLLSIISYAPFC
jgi:cellobiose-specific phosphotransferase system component IIC